jgi:hypothetical protein
LQRRVPVKIKNKDWSPRVVTVSGGKTIRIPARGTTEISEEDFNSPELQRLFTKRVIIVVPAPAKKP